jgi:hypothetical protein
MNNPLEARFGARVVFVSMWVCAIFVAIFCTIGDRIFPQHRELIRGLPVVAGALFGSTIAILYGWRVLRERHKSLSAFAQVKKQAGVSYGTFLFDFGEQDWAQLQTFVKIADAMHSSDANNRVISLYSFTDVLVAAAAENSIDMMRGRPSKFSRIDEQIRESSIALAGQMPALA